MKIPDNFNLSFEHGCETRNAACLAAVLKAIESWQTFIDDLAAIAEIEQERKKALQNYGTAYQIITGCEPDTVPEIAKPLLREGAIGAAIANHCGTIDYMVSTTQLHPILPQEIMHVERIF